MITIEINKCIRVVSTVVVSSLHYFDYRVSVYIIFYKGDKKDEERGIYKNE